jgi:pimeloyl-ACP methyl ester carboxylesterase
MDSVRNVVLVHGAWADGSSWSKIIPLLAAKGLHAVAVQNPLNSIADDVASANRLINAQDGPVLQAGHSYGGAVITEAGNKRWRAWSMWPLLPPMQGKRAVVWLQNSQLRLCFRKSSQSKMAS